MWSRFSYEHAYFFSLFIMQFMSKVEAKETRSEWNGQERDGKKERNKLCFGSFNAKFCTNELKWIFMSEFRCGKIGFYEV